MSAPCPLQKVHSSSRFPSLFLSSLESFLVLFLRAKLGECVASWFALTLPPLKWLTEQKNPFENAPRDTANLAILWVSCCFCCCCQLLLLNHNFRLRYLILSVSNSNFNLPNLIFGLIFECKCECECECCCCCCRSQSNWRSRWLFTTIFKQVLKKIEASLPQL